MHFRSLPFLLLPLFFLGIPSVFGQKKIFATVNPNLGAINSVAESFDPQTGTFFPLQGKMNVPREGHSAVLLPSGKILIAGGYNNRYLNSAEIFNPADGSFAINLKTTYNSLKKEYETSEGKLVTHRSGHAAVVMQSGRVLLLGGFNGSYVSTAEIYDPSTGVFRVTTGTMGVGRQYPTATLLNDGTVLITGGYGGSFLSTAETYNPATETFFNTGNTMSDPRQGHSATLLADGRVLVVGGYNNTVTDIYGNIYLSSADIYDPSTGDFSETGSLNTARSGHTASLLPDGRILIAGGTNGTSILNTAEIYDPQSGSFSSAGTMAAARIEHTAIRLSDGRILLAGGYSDHPLSSAEIFDPNTRSFTLLPSSMAFPRSRHTATRLNDGRVLFAGGRNSDLLVADVNEDPTDNISPNIVFSPDSQAGYISYTGSGAILAFSTQTGELIGSVKTGGQPTFITPLQDGQTMAAVSVWDNRIFMVGMDPLELKAAYSFANAQFGFGSIVTLSPDGSQGYISSTGTGEVIKFDITSGNEVRRLQGLESPAQITVTPDGGTLLVVDTGQTEICFVDSSSLTVKYKTTPLDIRPTANFTIFNKAVLGPDASIGVIASQDIGGLYGTFFIFDVSNGKILSYEDSSGEEFSVHAIGNMPGHTALAPNGSYWTILCQGSIAVIPTTAPNSFQLVENSTATPLGSANIVFSSDSRYAHYASITDHIFQHDLNTQGVVAKILAGDNPNVSLDQTSSVGITPDEKILAALNFASNEIVLLNDVSLLHQTKYKSQYDQFTGLTLINLSSQTTSFTLTAYDNFGSLTNLGGKVVNPAYLRLGPNAQASVELSQLFNFDNTFNNEGLLVIAADQPAVAGFATLGQISASYLGGYVSGLQGVPLYRKQLHDFIVPEIFQQTGSPSVELSFVNPNYNISSFTLTHYGGDGSVLQEADERTAAPSGRQALNLSDILQQPRSGLVLMAGGQESGVTTKESELFDPVSETFSVTTSTMWRPRHGHTATQLSSGKVLVVGGKNGAEILDNGDIFDPVTATFSLTTGNMMQERYRHTSTLLPGGKVLVTGGQNSVSINDTAEIYDARAGTFSATAGSMTSARDAHTATLMASGKVLIAGGLDGNTTSSSAELYNPLTSLFSPTDTMSESRAFHTAAALPDGKVLIAGGYNGNYLNSADIYDPLTEAFVGTVYMHTPRSNHTCTLLGNGTMLIAGGINSDGALSSAEIYDPTIGIFYPLSAAMASARSYHTATLLPDGRVLLAGGNDGSSSLDSSELYDPINQQFIETKLPLNIVRQSHTATFLELLNQGYVRASSQIGVQFTEVFYQGSTNATLNGIDVRQYIGVTKIFSPQFAIAQGYRTVLNLVNGNPENDAVVTITLHAPDGSVLGTPAIVNLPKNSQIKDNLVDLFHNDPAIQNRTGWLEVESSVDRVVGSISFSNSDSTFLAAFELSGVPLSYFLFPMAAEDGVYQTAIALLNSGDQPSNVHLELWGPEGTIDRNTSLTLPAGTRTALYLSDYFPGLEPRLVGNIRIRSDQPLHSFSILTDRNENFICAVPPIPLP